MWGGLADRFGRRNLLLLSLVLFIAADVGAALATSIEVLIAMRVLQGVGGSAQLSIGVGVISDIFPKAERGVSISVFFSGTLVGPIVGPIIGGFLVAGFGWRSTFWFLAAFTAAILLLTLCFLPETLAPRRGGKGMFNPFAALVLMRYPIVVLGCLVSALPFGMFFAVESFYSRTMEERYRLDASAVGLSCLVLGTGSILGNFFGGKLSDVMKNRQSAPAPEARLHGLWACASLLVGGLLTYGWCVEFGLPLWAPILATFFVGFGYTSGSIAASAYLVDLAPAYASSVTACATFVRMMVSAVTTGCNTAIIEGLGYGRGFSIHAAIAFLVVLITVLLVQRGGRIRQMTGPSP